MYKTLFEPLKGIFTILWVKHTRINDQEGFSKLYFEFAELKSCGCSRAPLWPRQNENPSKEFRTRLQENSLLICPWGEKGAFASDEKNIYKRLV